MKMLCLMKSPQTNLRNDTFKHEGFEISSVAPPQMHHCVEIYKPAIKTVTSPATVDAAILDVAYVVEGTTPAPTPQCTIAYNCML